MNRIAPLAVACLLALCGCHKASDTDRADLSHAAASPAPAASTPAAPAPQKPETTLDHVVLDGKPVTVEGMSLQRYVFQPSPQPQVTVVLDKGD